MSTKGKTVRLKTAVWRACLSPMAWGLWRLFFGDGLGVNPIEKLTRVTGLTTLILLLVTLAVSPLRRFTGWNPLIKLRRPLGLFAFFYAVLHFGIWMGLDLGFQLAWVWEDIAERPYITVGFTAFLLLIPLAVTSTRGWIRRLGKRWSTLHALVYLATALGLVHFYWLVKADIRLPVILATVFALLMATRLPRWWARWRRRRERHAESARTGPPPAASRLERGHRAQDRRMARLRGGPELGGGLSGDGPLHRLLPRAHRLLGGLEDGGGLRRAPGPGRDPPPGRRGGALPGACGA